MRILVVTNLYPPQYVGGYELRCAEVARELRSRGHEVQVVTSIFRAAGGTEEIIDNVPVARCLNQYVFPPYRSHRPYRFHQVRDELEDARNLREHIASFRPDVVNFWSMYGLAGVLLPIPRTFGIPDVYWLEQSWMIDQYGRAGEKPAAFWSGIWDGKFGPALFRPLSRFVGRSLESRVRRSGIPTRDFSINPAHVVFVSEYMSELHRQAGLQFSSTEVILGGVRTERFIAASPRSRNGSPLALLYAGQLSPDRGLLTLLEAVSLLTPEERSNVRLTVAGTGARTFARAARQRTTELGLDETVTFVGRVEYGAMPETYWHHDLLVFPSQRDEGLPLSMVEAMLAGCAVVTSGSGGASEVARLADLPTFPPGNAPALAAVISRALANPTEMHSVATRGTQVATAEFGIQRMVDRFEAVLERVTSPL